MDKKVTKKYKTATSKLKAGLEASNMDVLETCLRQRQIIIDQIDKIDERIRAVGSTAGLPQHHDIKPLLSEISMLETENLKQAQSQKEILKHEILANRKRFRLARGYQMVTPSAPARFVDKRGAWLVF